MVRVVPGGGILGARIEDLDLGQPLPRATFDTVMRAIGEYGVLCFPGQDLQAAQLKAFAANFGKLEINVAGSFQEPGIPEVMILSNIVENGKPIGLADAVSHIVHQAAISHRCQHGGGGDRIRIDLKQVLTQQDQIGLLAHLDRAELLLLAHLAGAIDGMGQSLPWRWR